MVRSEFPGHAGHPSSSGGSRRWPGQALHILGPSTAPGHGWLQEQWEVRLRGRQQGRPQREEEHRQLVAGPTDFCGQLEGS